MIKKNLLFAGGTLALSAALLTGGFLLGNNVQSPAEQAATDSGDTNRIIPLTAQEDTDKSDEWETKIDGWLASIMEEVNEYLDETMPEGYQEWKSFFRFGDSIARQAEDGEWEFSDDNGETWDAEAPEGFSFNEDGTRFRIGGRGDSEDYDPDEVEQEDYTDELERQYYKSGQTSAI